MDKQNITGSIKAPNKNLEKLKRDFAQCFDKNGDFDFDKFKRELQTSEIDFSKESYGLDWLGKSYARLLASDDVTTLLKEDEEWNKKQENKNSENLLLKGDNLEVLKYLSNAYYEKIKMIYIDPPYNTGSDGFVYQDDRKFTYQELSSLAGIDGEKAKRILDFTQSKSNSHSAWLTFMYPRLYIAKQLLKDDGVIFVSIDDNEVAQLRLLMDEIFGEENFVGEIIWQGLDTTKNDAKYFSNNHEYILCYSKYKELLKIKGTKRTAEQNKVYKNLDNDPRGAYLLTPLNAKSGTEEGVYTYTFKNGIKWTPPSGTYPRFSKKTLEELEKDNKIYFGKNNTSIPQKKTFLSEVSKYVKLKTFWDYKFAGSTRQSNSELLNLLGEKGIFQNPKPTKLLKIILDTATLQNDLILDFFAGSSTTGDAVMQLNAEDGGTRKYILVQIPEEIDAKKNKTAYDFVKNELEVEKPTIFDITKERLIRAGKKIQEDNKDKDLSKQDFGFKIFETISNDEGVWEEYNFEAEELNGQQKLFDETKLSDNDLKTLLTTWKTNDNIPLTQSLREIDLSGYTGYYFDTKLYLVNTGFKTENLKNLLEKIDNDKDFNPAIIIAFGYNFESKAMREIAEGVENYINKKHIDIDFITRY